MNTVEFYKEGDHMAIAARVESEDEFISSTSKVLSELIESGQFKGDWGFQFERWLPQIVDICCKLRGYKADSVHEQRTLIAGFIPPDAEVFTLGAIDNRKRVELKTAAAK